MRNIICLLLVLALCMSMTCTAFATLDSVGQNGKPPTEPSGQPVTGDHADLGTWVLVMFATLVVLAIVIICYCKFFKK